MLTIHVRKGMLGEDGIATKQVPWAEGLTPRSIVLHLQDKLPHHVPIDIGLNGELLTDDQYDTELCDNDELILCPLTTYGIDYLAYLIYAIISAVVSVAVSYAIQALTPKAKQPDDPRQRGDSSSATYAWDGIRTNYAQGFTVPIVYGRHAVGGQVVLSGTDIVESFTVAHQSDLLGLVLVLSEGPIYRIGDVVCSANDYLGTTSTLVWASQGDLPDHIRINDQLLANESQSGVVSYSSPVIAPNAWVPQTPDVNVNDPVWFRNHTTSTNIGQAGIVLTVLGSAVSPTITFSEPYPAGVTAAVNAGDTVAIHTQFPTANNTQPHYHVTNSTSGGLVHSPPNAGAMAFLRSGEIEQPPLPTAIVGAFVGTQTVFGLNLTLENFGEEHVWSYAAGTEEVVGVRIVGSAPNGLFITNSAGNQQGMYPLFSIQWRVDGGTWVDVVWPGLSTTIGAIVGPGWVGGARLGDIYVDFGQPISGDLEVKLRRESAQGGIGASTLVIWRDVTVVTAYEMTYPRVAYLGLLVEANSRFNGGLPQCHVRIDGKTVRVWDSTHGWSPRCWDVPASPFNWHTYPPGRNPAWALADFLLQPWGLGEYLTEDDLDLPSFAAWAVWCDRDPAPADPWGEAQFRCDIVMDAPRPAWEWVIAICATGHATPVFANGKIRIAYEYRDAHSQGSVSVPAKAPTQLFTSGNLQDLTVTWLPRATRPTAFVYQYLNEDLDYKQDVFTVEDGESTMNDPSELFGDKWRPQQQQAYGITRSKQIYRDGVFRHRINRLIARRIDFKTGRWALIGQVGDLIDVETEVMRPFDSVIATSGVVLVGGSSVSEIKVDHNGLPSTGQIKVRQPDGSPVVANWTGAVVGKVEETFCMILTLSSAVTVDAGAACVFGVADKLVETYQITGITITKKLERSVTALQWVPSIHDDILPGTYEDGSAFASAATDSPVWNEDALPPSQDVKVTRLRGGSQRLSWSSASASRSATTNVYCRESGVVEWRLLGSVTGNYFDTDILANGVEYEFSVAPEDFNDRARFAQQGTIVTRKTSEFTDRLPPSIAPVVKDQAGYLSWTPVKARGTEEYEIREGVNWVGARTLYRGTEPFVHWPIPPLQTNLSVCVEMEDGLQGQPTAIAAPAWQPTGSTAFVNHDVLATGALGTHTQTQIVGTSYIQLISGKLSGNYVTVSLAPGFLGPFLWRIALDVREYDGVLVDDLLVAVDSGEVVWRTVDAREATIETPGVDFTRSVDDAASYDVDHYESETVSGYFGASGRHTAIDLQGRFHDGSSWSAWATWTDQERTAQTCEVRLYLYRETTKHEVQVHGFTISAHL